jgi:hypothetical protein
MPYKHLNSLYIFNKISLKSTEITEQSLETSPLRLFPTHSPISSFMTHAQKPK